MLTRNDMKPWIIEALKVNNGKAWPKQVAQFV